MSERSISTGAWRVGVCAALLIALSAASAYAQSARKPAGTLILGEITSLAVNNMGDPASGGRLVIDGKQIIVPEKLTLGLASGKTSLQALMLAASDACKSQEPPQSGLATTDSCRGEKPPALARVMATANENGELVASLVMIQQNSARTLARIKAETNSSDSSYGRTGSSSYSKRSRKQPK